MNDRDQSPSLATAPERLADSPWAALPGGSRDLLPAAFRIRRTLTSTLRTTFEAWGYEPVGTPAIEYFDVLARGLSEDDRRGCIRFIAAGSGELVTLRADVTPQVARMLAQRWGGELPEDVVYRFSYAAEVLRHHTEARQQTEIHQVGIEMIGDDDPAADAELMALAIASLTAAGLQDFRLDLAHTAIARGLLDGLGLPDSVGTQAQALLTRKDRPGLDRLLSSHGCRGSVARATIALCDLFGAPADVLARAREVLADTGVDEALSQLSATLEHLASFGDDLTDRITLDLGEARGFDYYSGIRIRGWARGVHHPVIRGGRYDGLPRRYGVPRPATGFAVDLDALEVALAEQGGLTAKAEPPGHLVAIDPSFEDARARPQAQLAAREAREQGRRAWVQPGLTLERAQAQAEVAQADRLTFMDASGSKSWFHGPQGWTTKAQETA
ncbi:MAG: ATP phosphoribosyltransferase regulatory subunit [Myxococcota bacterium]